MCYILCVSDVDENSLGPDIIDASTSKDSMLYRLSQRPNNS